MKINFVEISKINNLNNLKKFNLKKPIFLNNYLFHYLIFTNNLKALKLIKFPIENENNDGYNGIILASKLKNYNILKFFLKKYEHLVYNVTKYNENFLHFCNPQDKNYLNIITKYKLNWTKLFLTYTKDDISNLDNLFLMGNYKTISNIIDKIKFKYSKYLKTPFTFSIILNDGLKSNEKIKLLKNLYKQDKNILKYNDNIGNNILYPIVLNNDYKILEYMYRQNIDFDSYTPINTYHIFKLAYNKGLATNKYKMAELIWDKIESTHDFSETNKHGDNLVHFILKSRIKNNNGNYKLESKLLKTYTNWNLINMNKQSPIDLISKLDFKKYGKFFNNNTIKNWAEMKKVIKKEKKQNNIKLINNKYSHGNIFQARFTDTAIFGLYLKNKYKNLYFPILDKKEKEKIKINYKLYKNLSLPGNMLSNNLNFPWIIIWNDEDNYFIHPYLNKLMDKNKKKYNYGFVYLSLNLPNDGLHASLVLYDFKKKIIERFDPYGNTMGLDTDMDNLLRKNLLLNGFTYRTPNRYLPVAGFQTISDENNILHTKFGDFGGYCLAWCIWYIEHRVLNSNVDSKTLVRKTINKFFTNKYKPMEFIRNYANKINIFRVEYLQKIKIPENLISNEVLPLKYLGLLQDNINENF